MVRAESLMVTAGVEGGRSEGGVRATGLGEVMRSEARDRAKGSPWPGGAAFQQAQGVAVPLRGIEEVQRG